MFDRLLYVTIQLINIRLYSFPSTHVRICYQLHIITTSIIMHEMDHYNIGNNRPTSLGTRHWLEVYDDDVCLSASNRGRTHLRNMMLLYSQQKKGALRFPLLVDIYITIFSLNFSLYPVINERMDIRAQSPAIQREIFI